MTTKTWPAVALGDVLAKSPEWIEIEPARRYKQITVRLWGQGVVERNEVAGSDIGTVRRARVRAGQFILSRIDARNGALGVVPPKLDGAVVSNDFPVFDVRPGLLLPDYLNWLSRTDSFVSLCKQSSEGTTNRVRLKEDRFLAMTIPLPPLNEQRRIVARVEQFAAKIEEARGLRRQAAQDAEALVATVGAGAFGLDGVRAVSVDSVCHVKGGIQKSVERAPGANPRRYITVAHVQRNRIDTGDPRYFEVSDTELEKWRLLPGDVLVIEGNGSADQIGRSALFRGEIDDCVHQNHVIRIRPNPRCVLPEYLNAYLNSPLGQEQMIQRSRTTSGLFNLSVGRIKSLEVPVPFLAEQRRIVAYLDGLQAQTDALKRLQAGTAAEIDALLPSILDRAFKGEL